MTDIERLILEGLHIMMQTQIMPRGGADALDAHCNKLLANMKKWNEDITILMKKDYSHDRY